MAEEFVSASLVLPGTYIRVRAEGLIGAGGISTGNIGVVGTAASGVGETHNLSSAAEALEHFGASDPVTTRSAQPDPHRSPSCSRAARATSIARGVAQSRGAGRLRDRVRRGDQGGCADPGHAGDDTQMGLDVLQPILESSENNGRT